MNPLSTFGMLFFLFTGQSQFGIESLTRENATYLTPNDRGGANIAPILKIEGL
ncbi:hypothetical protein GCM10027288_19290 [Bordetella tumbae]|uniref:hypothetical protein n=1 Tax=Bordetella tumbae TaxID=1649139 RepID=UPI0039F107C1